MSPADDIEHTAGATESAIHAAMMTEGGLPTLLGLFCEVNAGVLALTSGMLAVHELTALRRRVRGWPAHRDPEQHVHGFLERVPLMASVMLTVLHWDQACSVFGAGDDPDWRIRAKRRLLGVRYRLGVLRTVAALVALPYGQELARCLQARSADHS